MGRVTKIRAGQTRAADSYTKSDNSLATDKEVEDRVRKHSTLFHHNRKDNTELSFDTDGNLSGITIKNPDTDDVLQESSFTFDSYGNLTNINKTIYDGSDEYLKLKKTFTFDSDGNLESILNEIN